MRVRIALAVGAIAVGLSACGSPSASFKATATAVTVEAPNQVGVAFQVKNTGAGTGSPNCIVTAASSSTDGGTNGVVLDSIGPGQYDYESADSDVVTLSGDGAAAVSLADGGVLIKCT